MHQQVTSQSHSLSVLNSLAARPFAPQQHHHPTSNPLPDTTQAILTRAARTGHHLSQLAIASDPHAMAPRGQANVALAQAKSFNLGQDRFFRQGEYQPSSQRSQQLLANESPHLLKQTGGATRQKKPIQFKPKDIKSTHTLNVDNDGKITNSEAGRSDPPVSYPLNMAIKKGLVKSKDGDAVGGHLFKREYGGADNYSNVVTWSTKSESQFTTFENQYLEKAREDATGKGGVARQVNTEAKFSNFKVSLDDISLPDKETSDGQTIKNRTIQDEKNKKGGKQANHLLVNLIRGAVESIPDSVKASSKGVEAWEKSGKGDIMKVSESFDKEKVGTRFDYIMEGDQDEINEISRAVDKVKEM
ncbi:MAG: DUF4157 domain-containing protein [Cyanobacteria bacterium P01_E01_bin.45]